MNSSKKLFNLIEENFTTSEKILASANEISHVMAITLNPKTKYTEGLVRVVVKREGNIVEGNHTDRSELRAVVKRGE